MIFTILLYTLYIYIQNLSTDRRKSFVDEQSNFKKDDCQYNPFNQTRRGCSIQLHFVDTTKQFHETKKSISNFIFDR